MPICPGLKVISNLIEQGIKLKIYDPVAGPELLNLYKDHHLVTISNNAYDCLLNSEALVVLTEWNEFIQPDFEKMHRNLLKPIIIDGRNIFDPVKMQQLKFNYYSVGRLQ